MPALPRESMPVPSASEPDDSPHPGAHPSEAAGYQTPCADRPGPPGPHPSRSGRTGPIGPGPDLVPSRWSQSQPRRRRVLTENRSSK
jgi:hypothetical protein